MARLTGVESGLLISMLGNLSQFHLIVQIILMVSFMKSYLLRCWHCVSHLNWTGLLIYIFSIAKVTSMTIGEIILLNSVKRGLKKSTQVSKQQQNIVKYCTFIQVSIILPVKEVIHEYSQALTLKSSLVLPQQILMQVFHLNF